MTDLWLMIPPKQLLARERSIYLNRLVLSHVEGFVLSSIPPRPCESVRIKGRNDEPMHR